MDPESPEPTYLSEEEFNDMMDPPTEPDAENQMSVLGVMLGYGIAYLIAAVLAVGFIWVVFLMLIKLTKVIL